MHKYKLHTSHFADKSSDQLANEQNTKGFSLIAEDPVLQCVVASSNHKLFVCELDSSNPMKLITKLSKTRCYVLVTAKIMMDIIEISCFEALAEHNMNRYVHILSHFFL